MAVRVTARRSRKKTPTLLVGFGLLAVALVFSALVVSRQSVKVEAKTTAPTVVAQYDTVSVPVPAEYVPAGTKIKDIQFITVPYPKHQLVTGAVTDIKPFYEAVTITALPAKLPVFQENISFTSTSVNPVTEQIPQGMRAMTVRVDATSSVEGWVRAGAFVDVLLVQGSRTDVVAEGVKVLSAERSTAQMDNSTTSTIPSTVTLLVTQDQCLAINTAIPLGRLSFVLRGSTDEDKWASTTFTSERLKGSQSTKSLKSSVNGYVSVKDGKNTKTFANVDGKWLKTDSVPEGFFSLDRGNEGKKEEKQKKQN